MNMPGRREPCHCGSGKRYKNCCYANDAAKAAGAKPIAASNSATISLSKIGVPGEEASVLITFVAADGTESPIEGSAGEYDVVFYFRKPGAVVDETAFSLGIDEHVGSSLLAIANPAMKFNDSRFDGQETKMRLHVITEQGQSGIAIGEANKAGYLSDLRITVIAASIKDAGYQAKLLLLPAISTLAFASDIPLHISYTVVREKATPGYVALTV